MKTPVPILIVDDNAKSLAVIESRKLSQRLPIIFISGHRTDSSDVNVGYEAGGADYVCKPFDPFVVRAKVKVFAELYRQRVELTTEAANLRAENNRLQQFLTTQTRNN